MAAGIEISDSNGVLQLSSQHMLLTLGAKGVLGTGALGRANTTVWDDAGGYNDPQTGAVQTSSGGIEFISRKASISFKYDSWFMPLSGGIVYTQGLDSYAVKSGSDFNIAYMKDAYPTESDKYLSVYDTAGNLMWSAASLIKAAVVLEKINLNGAGLITLDLSKYGVPVEELYLKTSLAGSIGYGDYGLDSYNGLAVKRVNNILYIRAGSRYGWSNITRAYYIYVARIRS